ncbi:MAG: SIP domain-containing protein [Microbacterium sp.]|uniref:SIP domain-containing protein n=1 Tax=Microbacterium sp. TaxID=51671 RepID=UPI0039E255CE
MNETATRTAPRRAARKTRVPHLVTADETSLVDLEMLLATLPLCATGRVFVEVPDESYVVPITVPARMTLTWLARDRRSGAPGSCRGCASGEALSRAVIAWADEMMCAEDDTTTVTLLGGFLGTAEIVDHLLARGVDAARIHAPERFGLLPR